MTVPQDVIEKVWKHGFEQNSRYTTIKSATVSKLLYKRNKKTHRMIFAFFFFFNIVFVLRKMSSKWHVQNSLKNHCSHALF